MSKKICFIYTETTGLHKTHKPVSKKELFNFARPVVINYEIGNYKKNEYVLENKVRQIIKPRCLNIPEETVQFHGITQEIAEKEGIEIETVINQFKKDIKNVNVIISHNVDFHLKTLIAESVKYNIPIDFSNYLIIDTISFFHEYDYIKLKDLFDKLNLKKKKSDNLEMIKLVFLKLYENYVKSF
jgi:DNA polymerase III epsilon subunit-like protein